MIIYFFISLKRNSRLNIKVIDHRILKGKINSPEYLEYEYEAWT